MLRGEYSDEEENLDDKEAELERLRRELMRERKREQRRKEQVLWFIYNKWNKCILYSEHIKVTISTTQYPSYGLMEI